MKINKLILALTLTSVLISCKNKKQTVSSTTAKSIETETKKADDQPTIKVDVVEGLNLGNRAPEFKQASALNKEISLSSLKGKVVLIDFWASWCGPCRKENPAVVAAFNKYHNSEFKNGKGFEILSVSLDQNKEAWLNAIVKDKLTWPNHVCDLLGWNNEVAKRYGVNSIPTNFLINGEGVIIGKALRGEYLEKAIETYLK